MFLWEYYWIKLVCSYLEEKSSDIYCVRNIWQEFQKNLDYWYKVQTGVAESVLGGVTKEADTQGQGEHWYVRKYGGEEKEQEEDVKF